MQTTSVKISTDTWFLSRRLVSRNVLMRNYYCWADNSYRDDYRLNDYCWADNSYRDDYRLNDYCWADNSYRDDYRLDCYCWTDRSSANTVMIFIE